jgi:predicted GNAT family N-acyltransferase
VVDGGRMLDNFTINFINHSEINESLIDKIIALKQQHWGYTYESQLNWINSNLTSNDFHIIMQDYSGKLISYANLVKRNVNDMEILGIGNVCVNKDVQESGIGTLLMNISKFYAKQLSLDLILLCKKELVPFYEKCGFTQYQYAVFVGGLQFKGCVMLSTDIYDSTTRVNINSMF